MPTLIGAGSMVELGASEEGATSTVEMDTLARGVGADADSASTTADVLGGVTATSTGSSSTFTSEGEAVTAGGCLPAL